MMCIVSAMRVIQVASCRIFTLGLLSVCMWVYESDYYINISVRAETCRATGQQQKLQKTEGNRGLFFCEVPLYLESY